MRRRLFVALLAAGLLLVAGFTAAAVASGGSPFALLEDQPSTADDTTMNEDTLDRTTTEKESTEDESSKEAAEDEKAPGKTSTHVTKSSHKVTICHHTGSKKHPFHPIALNEHAVPAHTGHGDTVGPCPTTTASATPAAKHAKPRSDRSEQGGRNGKSQSHRPGKHAGRPSD